MEKKYIAAEDISFKLGSKKNLYDLIKVDLNFVLPPYKKCLIEFIKKILAKKKLTIKNDEAKLLPVPRYTELSTEKIWNLVQDVPDLMKYFPDIQEKELPDREFMWTILSTLREDAVKKLIEDARKKRSASNEEDKEELIEIDQEILNLLLAAPNINKERGRVAYLLKSKNSIKRKRREQKVYEANLDILRRKSPTIDRKTIKEKEDIKDQDDMNIDDNHSRSLRTSPRRRNEMKEDFEAHFGSQTPFKPKRKFPGFSEM